MQLYYRAMGRKGRILPPAPRYAMVSMASVEATAGATTVTLTGPTSGTTGVASSNFTATANGAITGTVVVTPAATGGGTFTPATVSLTTATQSATFTYTPASTGVKSISITNNSSSPVLANSGTPISYTSNAASASLPAWVTATPGQWATISGTTAPGGVGNNFSGVAWRVDPTHSEVLSALAGGHSAGTYATSNPVYSISFAADAPAWTARRAASDTTGWSATLPTTEYFTSDNRPIPRHTYNANHWVPELNAYIIGGTYALQTGDKGIIEHRGFRMTADGGSDDWLARATYTDKVEFHVFMDARNTATGKYVVGNGDSSNFYEWNPNVTPQTWTSITPTGTPSTSKGGHAYDYRRNSFTFVGSDGRWWTLGTTFLGYTMNATTWAKTAVTINASTGYTDFSTYLNIWYHATCRYNENDDAYYLYNGNTFATAAAAGRIYKVFPNETQAWDMLALPRAGTYTSVETVGSDNRLEVIEKYRTAVSIEPGQVAYYYRLPYASQIVVRSGTVTGTVPYTATLLPLRAEVPSGYTVVSPDDSTLKATILSTHDDGSAAVIIATGETSVTANAIKRLAVTIATASADTALTTARFAAAGLTSVAVDFTGHGGTATLSTFTSPETTWWANSRVICCSYRVAAPTPGSTAMEAVVYLTAFAQSSRVQVEVVIENSKFNPVGSTFASKPADATYTAMTVAVNGSTIATVSSSAAPTGTHQAFRAWYASGWVGGDPETRATQRHIDLQRHPLFWRTDKANTADLSIYTDAYTPWSTGRHPASNMAGGGDVPSIGPLTEWDARALQTGDYRCWKASEANALCALSFNINFRDSVTGTVPESSRMSQKYTKSAGTEGTWPETTDGGSTRAIFDHNHAPAMGLMGFVARPSPVFIEITQRTAVFAGTYNNLPDRLALFDSAGVGITDMTGITYPGAARALAWGWRQTAHATFLSPDGSAWKTGGRVWLGRIARMARAIQIYGGSMQGQVIGPYPSILGDDEPTFPGYQVANWMSYFLTGEVHKIAAARLITDATESGYMTSFADWMAGGVAAQVNDQTDGGWRFVPDRITYKKADLTIPTDFLAERLYTRGGWVPPTVAGQFYAYPQIYTTPATINAMGFETTANDTYTVQFWDALRVAVERDVTGARTAWATVQTNLTDLATWRGGFATRPRWGSWPRNL